jgi:hypothetical protein
MDEQLRNLRTVEWFPALDALDDRIMLAFASRQREAFATRRLMLLAAFVSLGGGIAAGSLLSPPAVAAGRLTPFVPVNPLASATMPDRY